MPYCPVLVLALSATLAAAALPTTTRSFDADPHWDQANNRPPANAGRPVKQDFGPTINGVGGTVHRSATLAYCALPIPARTLDKPLSAEGDLVIEKSAASSGCFFGFFNAKPGAGGRPANALGLDLDGESRGARLFVRLISPTNQQTGLRVDGGDKKQTPLPIDGHPRHFKLSYNPAGNGALTFQLDTNPPQRLPLPAWARTEHITFDRFGLMNTRKSGNAMVVHFRNLRLDDEPLRPAPTDWDQSGNHAEFTDTHLAGDQDFGFSPTHFAGGKSKGELGGTFWRSERPWAYYAAPTGPLDSTQSLEASGTVAMTVGAPDSGVLIGFFSPGKLAADKPLNHFVGIHIEGPSRIGHYFAPEFAGPRNTKPLRAKEAPVLIPDGKPHHWKLSLQSKDDGSKNLHVQLDDKTADLPIPPNTPTATVNHFGVLPNHVGGSEVRIYFDDLTYTTAPKPAP